MFLTLCFLHLLSYTCIIQLLNTYQLIDGKQLIIVQSGMSPNSNKFRQLSIFVWAIHAAISDKNLSMYLYLRFLLKCLFDSLVRALCTLWICRVSCLYSKNLQQKVIKDHLRLVSLLFLWYILLNRSSSFLCSWNHQ